MNEGDLFDNLPTAEEQPREPRRAGSPADEVPEVPEETPAAVAETAPEEPPVAVTETVPEVKTAPPPAAEEPPPPPKRRHVPLPRAGSLGQTLAELRQRNHMDLAAVADETRIKQCYLEALEKDDFADLPHMVYTLAYVKKLCRIYGVSDADADELMSGLREQLAYEIPEDIDKSVICREQDEETRRKLQQISVALIAGAALIVLLLVIGGTTLVLRSRKNSARTDTTVAATEEQLNEEWLARHRQPRQLKATRSIHAVPQLKNRRGPSRR